MADQELSVEIKVLVEKARAAVKAFGSSFGGLVPAAKKIQGAFKSLQANWLALVAAFAAIKGVISAVGSFVKAFGEAEDAQNRLRFALESTGQASLKTLAGLRAFNSGLQETTRFEDDAIAGLQALLVTMGASARDLPGLTKATLDYATVFGKDLSVAALDVSKALQGNVTMLQKYGIQVDAAKIQTEGASAVIEAMGKFAGTAAADAQTTAGSIAQLGNKFGDLKEQVGEAIVKSEGWRTLMQTVSKAMDEASTKITGNKAAIESFSNVAGLLVTSLSKVVEWLFKIPAALQLVSSAMIATISEVQKLATRIPILGKHLGDASQAAMIADMAWEDVSKSLDALTGSAVAAENPITSNADALEITGTNAVTAAEKMRRASEESDRLAAAMLEGAKRTDELSGFLSQLDLSQLFAGVDTEGEIVRLMNDVAANLREAFDRGLLSRDKFDEFSNQLEKAATEGLEGVELKRGAEKAAGVLRGGVGTFAGAAAGTAIGGPVGGEIGGQIGGLLQEIGKDSKAFAENIVQSARDFIKGLAEGIPTIIEVLIAAVPEIVLALVKAIPAMLTGVLTGTFKGLADAGKSIAGWFSASESTSERIARKFSEMEASVGNLGASLINSLATSLDRAEEAFGGETLGGRQERVEARTLPGADFGIEGFLHLVTVTEDLKKGIPDATNKLKFLSQEIADLEHSSESLTNAQQERLKELQTEKKAMRGFLNTMVMFTDEITELSENEDFRKAFEEQLNERIELQQAAFEQERAMIQSTFAGRMQDLERIAEEERGFAQTAADERKADLIAAFDDEKDAIIKKMDERRAAVIESVGFSPEDFADQSSALEALQGALKSTQREFELAERGIRKNQRALSDTMSVWSESLKLVQDRMQDIQKQAEDMRSLREDVGRGFGEAIRKVSFATEGPIGTGAIGELRGLFQQAGPGEAQARAAEDLKNALISRFDAAQQLSEEGIISNAEFLGIQNDTLAELRDIQANTTSGIDLLVANSEASLAILQIQSDTLTGQLDAANAQMEAWNSELEKMDQQTTLLQDQIVLQGNIVEAMEGQKSALDAGLALIQGTEDNALLLAQEKFDIAFSDIDKNLAAELEFIDTTFQNKMAELQAAEKAELRLLSEVNRIGLAEIRGQLAFLADLQSEEGDRQFESIEAAIEAATSAERQAITDEGIAELGDVLRRIGEAQETRRAFPTRQGGGIIPETGPFLMHRGESVTPAMRSGNDGGGGSSNVITINIQAWDGADVKRVMQAQVIPQLREALRGNKGQLRDEVKKAAA